MMDTNDESLKPGQKVELTYSGQSIAVLEVDSKWIPDKATEALQCYGTSSLEHPGVLMIATERGKYYIGGKVCYHAKLHATMACGITHSASYRAPMQLQLRQEVETHSGGCVMC